MTNKEKSASDAELNNEASQRDLRAELNANLESQFKTKLEENGTLPNAAVGTLVSLLQGDSLTTAKLIAALSLEDPIDTEVSDD